MKEKSPAEHFADSTEDDVQDLIDWAHAEIKEYKKLIKILEKRRKK